MLNALVSSEQVRFKQTSETVCTDGRVPNENVWVLNNDQSFQDALEIWHR